MTLLKKLSQVEIIKIESNIANDLNPEQQTQENAATIFKKDAETTIGIKEKNSKQWITNGIGNGINLITAQYNIQNTSTQQFKSITKYYKRN